MKNDLKRKAVSTLLAGSLIFGSGALTTKVDAYSLSKPTTTLEEFNKYDGVKIFINGRLVEFNDSLGYPYISSEGRTMIPLRAVAETFGALVDYNGALRVASVSRFGKTVETQIDNKKMVFTDTTVHPWNMKAYYNDVPTVIKNNRTYVPLRAVFELFGMNVRWDNATKTAHIESNYSDFKNIDFKDEKVISIKDLDVSKVNKVTYDGVSVTKDYVNILKNSDQYKVIIKDNEAIILSYQMLYNLDYFYAQEKESLDYLLNTDYVILSYINKEELTFFNNMCFTLYADANVGYSGEEVVDYHRKVNVNETQYKEVMSVVKSIGDDVKKQTLNKEEQVKLVVHKLTDMISYYIPDILYYNSYEGLIVNKGVCSSYQKSFDLIMRYLDIPSVSVYGDDHMWGRVYLNGEWKSVDVTFADGFSEGRYIDDWILFDIDLEKSTGHNIRKDIEDDVNLLELTYKFY